MNPAVGRGDPPEALIDWDAATKNIGGDEGFLRALIGTFVGSSASMVEEIRSASRASDAVELRRLAHTLKGSLTVFSAEPARAAAEALEELVRGGEMEHVEPAIARVEAELERLLPSMRARLE